MVSISRDIKDVFLVLKELSTIAEKSEKIARQNSESIVRGKLPENAGTTRKAVLEQGKVLLRSKLILFLELIKSFVREIDSLIIFICTTVIAFHVFQYLPLTLTGVVALQHGWNRHLRKNYLR